MRGSWRQVLAILAASAMGVLGAGAAGGQEPPAPRVSLVVELNWSVPGSPDRKPALEPPADDLTLEFTDGHATEALAWPWDAVPKATSTPVPIENGAWRLGSDSVGRVRLRIEAGLDSSLVVRRGEETLPFPITSVLERSQTIGLESGLTATLERLARDVLTIDFGGPSEKGIVEPGTAVPVTIGYNILHPDAAEVTVRTTAVLRPIGGREPVWQFEQREAMPANRSERSSRIWSIPAPAKEGTYVLEVEAAWEAAGVRDASRIGRLIRRRRPAGAASAVSRTVTLAVVSPRPSARTLDLLSQDSPPRETEVDAFDLSRLRNTRFSAFGRSPAREDATWEPPAEILVQALRREKEREWLRSFISKPDAEPGRLAAADESGLAWSAVSIRQVARPDRPHRLTVAVTGGDPGGLAALLIDPGGPERRPRVLVDSCGTASPVGGEGPRTMQWLFWPGSDELLLVLVNRHATSAVSVGAVRLAELEAPAKQPGESATGAGGRAVGLHVASLGDMERFAMLPEPGREDVLATAENLANYAESCGASFVVLPGARTPSPSAETSGGLSDEARGKPDRMEVVRRVLRRRGIPIWVEPDLVRADALPDLPPSDSDEAMRLGLARIGPTGEPDGGVYQPLHPRVRDAIKRRLVELVSDRAGEPGYAGVLLRLGRGPTLLGTPESGMDDETYARFVRETFGPDVAKEVPGLDVADPRRFAARAEYLAGVGRMPWLAWRAKAVAGLYTELESAVREAAPGAVLALSTPILDDGAVGAEARRVDLAGLPPSQAWRSVGLDLEAWPRGAEAPAVFRGVGVSRDEMASDLASHPDLDATVLPFPRRGVFLHADRGKAGTPARPGQLAPVAAAPPGGPIDVVDSTSAHAIAALDARWIVLDSALLSGREGRVRKFADLYRQMPASDHPGVEPVAGAKDSGVVVRSIPAPGATTLQIVNDTPYAIRLAGVLRGDPAAPVEDLGRRLKLAPQATEAGRQLVVDLAPHGLSVVRIGSEGGGFERPALYPPDPVLATMESRFQDLATQLAVLNRGLPNPITEPPNPGFEAEPVAPASATEGGASPAIPGGWELGPGRGAGTTLLVDEKGPHRGLRCLGLRSEKAGASVLSGSFQPGPGTGMLVQTFLRADKPQKVLVWIEGERQGRPVVRRSEVEATTEWRPVVVRASDLPAGGLDSARLRFEATAPGSIWLDDVRVLGEIAPKPVRVNAQRTLLAALQAYRERRYAEFARLAESRWAKHPGLLALIRGARESEQAALRPKAADEPTPAASALPADRTLR